MESLTLNETDQSDLIACNAEILLELIQRAFLPIVSIKYSSSGPSLVEET